MKKLFFLLILFYLISSISYGKNIQDTNAMKIKLTIENQKEIIVRMADNSAAEQFIKMLPANFEFIDFAGEEKISEFSRPISLNNVPRGMIASAGKMFIYVPWGNWGFFYKDHGDYLDKSLIELGQIESGLEILSTYEGDFNAKIEVFENCGD